MKKVACVAVMGMFVAMGSFLLGGCGNNGVSFVIRHSEMGSFCFKDYNKESAVGLLVFVNSHQELRDLCSDRGNPAFLEGHSLYNSAMSIRLRSFDEQFFRENRLVIYTFEKGHARETRINSLTVEGAELIIHARYRNRRGTFTDEAFTWTMLIEIPVHCVENVTTVSINHR